MKARKTVPFIAKSTKNQNENIFLLDRIEIKDSKIDKSKFFLSLKRNLKISENSKIIEPEIAIQMVENQYEACLEFMYSHSVWEEIRNGNKDVVLAYLL